MAISFVSLQCAKDGCWALAYLSMGCWTCLAETVPLFDGNPESFVYCRNEFLGQGCGPAVEHTEAAEIILVDFGMLSEQQDYRRDHVRKGYSIVLDDRTKFLDLEFWHHDQGEAAVETLAYQTI